MVWFLRVFVFCVRGCDYLCGLFDVCLCVVCGRVWFVCCLCLCLCVCMCLECVFLSVCVLFVSSGEVLHGLHVSLFACVNMCLCVFAVD